MKLTFKHSRITAAVIIAISLSSCSRFETRMQANGSFDYEHATLNAPYTAGEFSNAEARNSYDIPALTEQQKAVGFTTTQVDVRPPTQLMAVIDGVILEAKDDTSTKIWFNAFNQSDDMQAKIWSVLESYLDQKNAIIIDKDIALQEMGNVTIDEEIVFGSYFNKNHIEKQTSYKFSTERQPSGHSVALIVDALSYQETNDGNALSINLVGSSKQDVEVRFINDLLAHAYQLKEAEQLENGDTQPLSIKLGFDDNHQNAWIVDSEFLHTWLKLPELFTLLNFSIVESDKNLGYFLLKYKQPSDDYWVENDLQYFDLEEDEYFVQLGEVTGGTTSISWLDEDKKPLSDQKITEIYLSITKHVRGVLLENDRQTKDF